MYAQDENNGLSVECKVVAEKNGYFVSGQFDYFVPIVESDNKLDQIEIRIEQVGQELKRIVCGRTIEADDTWFVRRQTLGSHQRRGRWIASTHVEKWNPCCGMLLQASWHAVIKNDLGRA